MQDSAPAQLLGVEPAVVEADHLRCDDLPGTGADAGRDVLASDAELVQLRAASQPGLAEEQVREELGI